MAQLNFAKREITTKIVYYGATDAGVSTNVEQLASAILPSRRSEVLRFAPPGTELDTLCFEAALDQYKVGEFPLRATIYGIPGGLMHPGMRNEVLSNVDGVVFVADARAAQEQANIESLLELERVLREAGIELTSLPIVLQVNHSDATDARAVANVALDLNPYGFPVHSAVARSGLGVVETLNTVVGLLSLRIENTLNGQSSSVKLDALQDAAPADLRTRVSQHLKGIEFEEARARDAADPRVRFANLSISATVRVRYQNEGLRGTRPTQLLSADLDGEDILIDLIHERINGGSPRRIKVLLENLPTDMDLLPRPQAQLSTDSSRIDVTANLPDSVELHPAEPRDMPPLAYGIIGVTCGLLLGLLLGVIFFL